MHLGPYLAGTATLAFVLLARLVLETPPPSVIGPPTGVLAEPLDLNRATAAELEALPGIGPRLAARIVEARDRRGGFEAVNDLLEVSGIGPRTLVRLGPQVTVGARSPP